MNESGAPRDRSSISKGRTGIITLACVAILAAPWSTAKAHDSDDHPSDIFYNPNTYNGKKIYLSPAHHWSGPKMGCGAYVEDNNMEKAAKQAANGDPGGDLVDRGYKVRVGQGDPDDNTARSNNWTSNRHIPMHSNASSNAECPGGAASTKGTIVFYYPGSANGEDLSQKLKNKLGEVSPGTNDHIATQTFYELAQTTMPAAYLEAEFHDWTAGKDWLIDYTLWDWRVGWAVDVHFGYP